MSELNDRGTKKWVSLMLPEHIQLLKDLWKEDGKKSKPILDEQELEEINMKLHLAIHHHSPVQITYYKDYDYKVALGRLKNIDTLDQTLQLEDFTRIKLVDIIDVHVE